jgi:hypothetical protein
LLTTIFSAAGLVWPALPNPADDSELGFEVVIQELDPDA